MSNNQPFHTFVELHLIQNFAPANLNRDDTNNPKECEFGGHRRARISSQALKRAIRVHPRFSKITGYELSSRSRNLARVVGGLLQNALIDHNQLEAEKISDFSKDYERIDDVVWKVSLDFIADFGTGITGKGKATHSKTLIFMPTSDLKQFASTLHENWDAIIEVEKKNAASKSDKKKAAVNDVVKVLVTTHKNKLKKKLKNTSAPDIALFGRMVAGSTELNIDAACQVSHAISTHKVNMEMDYFTAVDDLTIDSEQGAAMIDFTGFNSSCFYRYARIDWTLLVQNLNNDVELARKTVQAFLRTAFDAIPSGKQTSFASHNPTNLAFSVLRHDGMSWNLSNAFEAPVRANVYPVQDQTGFSEPSMAALDQLWGGLEAFYDDHEVEAKSLYVKQPEAYLEKVPNLRQAVQPTISQWVSQITDRLN